MGDGDQGSTNVFATERGADGFAHGDEGVVTRGGGVVPDVKLDAVGDGEATPARGIVVV